jgi:hypothetical protein
MALKRSKMASIEFQFPTQPARTNPAAFRRIHLREELWPGVSSQLWDRKKAKGFCTIPRTLPLIMRLIDDLSAKGKNASQVFFDLWCRAFDESLVEVSDEEAFAFSAGFDSPGRNVRSWRERMDVLRDLGFVQVAPNGSRRFGYILLLDPHRVVRKLHTEGRVPANWWGAFMKRVGETGYKLPEG